MKQVGVCGNFGSKEAVADGQAVKTKILTSELKGYFGENEVITLNTYGWKRNPIRLLFGCIKLTLLCKNVIILPAQNGIKVFAPLFSKLCKLFNKKLHYSVIGGWLPEYLEENQNIIKNIKSMKAVYVETKTMKNGLLKLGIENVVHMPNFKNLNLVAKKELPNHYDEPYKLCTFSRVKKEKGIIDAISAVKEINDKLGKKAFSLDIYGTVEPKFEGELNSALLNSNDSAHYKGLVDFNKSTEVLKDYFALIFPTYYVGEGFPGTIIDAFSSGLPVIASDWRYNSELISNGKTGCIYKLNNVRHTGLQEVLASIYENPEKIISMKYDCIEEAKKYDASTVMGQMIQRMEN